MARVALLIGTGEYAPGFKPLPAAPKDVEAIATILRDLEMGGFDQVHTLINPQYSEMNETIETWFRERQKDDLALLYISGHGVKDAQLDLYFAACNTRKQKEELVRATAVAASFVRDRIRESKAKRQIVILDCCFSGAFGDLLARDDDTINLEELLGAEGRVVMTSSSSIQYSFEQRDGELSIYTRYLVEGIRTGAADTDGDGAISVQELHEYARRKVQEESPAMSPKIIVLKDEGYQLRIAKAPLGDPKVKYRREVDAIVQEDGEAIDEVLSRPLLEEWQQKLGLSDEEVGAIEFEILEPIRQRQAKTQRYREVFTRAIQHKNPLGERERKRLEQLRQVLGLLEENVRAIEEEILASTPLSQPLLDLPSSEPLPSAPLRELPVPASTSNVDLPATDRPSRPVVERSRNHDFSIDLGNGIQLEMIAIPGGKFLMGSPAGEGHDDEKPQHEVAIAPFYIGKYPITQEQYEAVMGNNPSNFKGAKRPVEQVSWNEAVEFCRKLSEKSDRSFRLPSEAEWEYACRAGTTTAYSFGDRISKENVNFENHYKGTTEVGRFPANAFGLHDMHGNVWEWCADHWHSNYQGAPTDGSAWIKDGDKSYRLLRGGSWDHPLDHCRSAYRTHCTPDPRYSYIGFRVACS
jgi:formylglycine-generating enzyme required for sulfatase activity